MATRRELFTALCHTAAMQETTNERSTIIPGMVSALWKATLISGLLSVALGVAALVWPGKTLIVSAIIFGAYLLVSGVAQVAFAFALHVSAGSRVLMFISGAASIVLAFLAFRHFGEGYAILLLAIWIGVGFIFRGVATTGTAIGDPELPGRGWNIFFGIVTLLAGIVMLASPILSIVTLTYVVGAWLLVIGAFEIGSAIGMRKDAKG